jgi:hypothetical protein
MLGKVSDAIEKFASQNPVTAMIASSLAPSLVGKIGGGIAGLFGGGGPGVAGAMPGAAGAASGGGGIMAGAGKAGLVGAAGAAGFALGEALTSKLDSWMEDLTGHKITHKTAFSLANAAEAAQGAGYLLTGGATRDQEALARDAVRTENKQTAQALDAAHTMTPEEAVKWATDLYMQQAKGMGAEGPGLEATNTYMKVLADAVERGLGKAQINIPPHAVEQARSAATGQQPRTAPQ